MAITYVGATSVAPPNIVNTEAIYTLTAPSGMTGPALIIATVVFGGNFPTTVVMPAGWTNIPGVGHGSVWVFPWSTGSPTSWTIAPTGTGAGYLSWVVAAYNSCVFDTSAAVSNSAQSPPVTTSTPYDWLASILITCHASAAGSQTCTAMTRRVSSEWTTSAPTDGGVYGIALADTGAVVGQGLTSSSDYVWSPALSTLTGWGTVTVALSGALTPSLPTNYTPTNGAYVDFSTEQYFAANYNNTDGSTCQGYQFRLKASGASSYTYWNAGSAAFQSAAVWNTGAAQFTLPAGTLSNSGTYNWSFNTESSFGATLTSGFASDLTVLGQPAPRVMVTSPTGIVTSSSPTIVWSGTPGGTTSLSAYRIVTYTAATAALSGFTPGQLAGLLDDSGTTPGVATSYETTYLPNNTAFVTFVQVTQTGNQTSAWTSTSYTTSFSIPPTPTLTTAGPQLDSNGAPVVALTVTTGGFTTSQEMLAVVYYTDADTPAYVAGPDATLPAVGTGTPLRAYAVVSATGSTVVISDYEVTFGVPRTYYAVVVSENDGPSGPSAPVTVTQNSSQCFLSDPLNPTLFLALHRLAGQSSSGSSVQAQTSIEIDRTRDQTIFYPFGKSTATVQYGSVYQPTFTLNFWLNGYADAKMYDALWASMHTLLFRSDMGDAWYVDVGASRPLSVLSDGSNRVVAPQYIGTLTCSTTDKP